MVSTDGRQWRAHAALANDRPMPQGRAGAEFLAFTRLPTAGSFVLTVSPSSTRRRMASDSEGISGCFTTCCRSRWPAFAGSPRPRAMKRRRRTQPKA
jgi:hypothetical protein